MNELTRILSDIDKGDPHGAAQLLPPVYDELRKLAAQRLSHQPPGQTLQPTALVHEAYLRLDGDPAGTNWDSRGHFFAAAAEAMRRILVENARRKGRHKHGGALLRCEFDAIEQVAVPEVREDLVARDEALIKLAAVDPQAAKLVDLRYFAGLSIPEAAESMGISPRTADRLWTYARVWLLREIAGDTLAAPLAASGSARRRFVREARAAAVLDDREHEARLFRRQRVILANFLVAVLHELADNVGVGLDQFGHLQFGYLRVVGSLRYLHALVRPLDLHHHLVVILEDLGEERVAEVNALAGLDPVVHRRDVFPDLLRDFRLVRLRHGLDPFGQELDRAPDIRAVVEQEVEHLHVRLHGRVAGPFALAGELPGGRSG